jgi:hypothetical protein
LIPQPPAGTYSPVGTKAFQADAAITDLSAVSQTAINLNAQTGPLHLSDANTRIVRDLILTTAAALSSYGQGATTAGTVQAAWSTGLKSLGAEVTANPTLQTALAVVSAAIAALQ